MTPQLLTGDVIHGDQRGRLLGYPTANLSLSSGDAPRFGVYAGLLDGRPAAISVGVRPTFGGGRDPLLEAHVLDFSGDLYGQRVGVELLEFLREERAFDGAESLVAQIEEDVRATRAAIAGREGGVIERVERLAGALGGGEVVLIDGGALGDGVSQLTVAAEHADARVINRMAADARGLIVLAMTGARCDQLGLDLQRSGRHRASDRAFTLSIEARHGVTTGISAHDRAVTVAAAIADGAKPHDVVVPGHVFPLRVADGGTFERPHVAEAGVDLALIARVQPAVVACTVLDDGGEVAGRDAIAAYVAETGVPVGTPADVLAYRRYVARKKALLAPSAR